MGYIESNLMRGEQIIYTAKLHGIAYALPIIVMFIAIAVCCALPADAAGIVGLVVFTICVLWCVEIHGGRQFVLTNKRVIRFARINPIGTSWKEIFTMSILVHYMAKLIYCQEVSLVKHFLMPVRKEGLMIQEEHFSLN